MADNTTLNTGTGGDVISTDDVTTLNGSVSSGVKVQRVKVMFGDDNTARDVSDTYPLPIYVPANTSIVSKSGTITTGGTAQQLMAANTARKGWSIRNNSTGSLWFNELGSTAIIGQPSFEVKAGEYFEAPIGGSSESAISIIGATTGQSFTAREW